MIRDSTPFLYSFLTLIYLTLIILVLVNIYRNYKRIGKKRTKTMFHILLGGYYIHIMKLTLFISSFADLVFDEDLQIGTIYYHSRNTTIMIGSAALIMLVTDLIFQWRNKQILESSPD